jgi:hypothetical protein
MVHDLEPASEKLTSENDKQNGHAREPQQLLRSHMETAVTEDHLRY